MEMLNDSKSYHSTHFIEISTDLDPFTLNYATLCKHYVTQSKPNPTKPNLTAKQTKEGSSVIYTINTATQNVMNRSHVHAINVKYRNESPIKAVNEKRCNVIPGSRG
jgi:hypothetical protein